jgi:hypothetical protein
MKKNLFLFFFLAITSPFFIKSMETPMANKVEIKKLTLQNRYGQSAKCVTVRIPSEMSSREMQTASRKDIKSGFYCTEVACCLCLGTSYYLLNQRPVLMDDPTPLEYLKIGIASICGYGNTCFFGQRAKGYYQNAINLKRVAVAMSKAQPAAKDVLDVHTLGKQARQS